MQEVKFSVTLRHHFEDPRLAFDSAHGGSSSSSSESSSEANASEYVTLLGEETKKIWLPDTFVRNARSMEVSSNKFRVTEGSERVLNLIL